VAKPTIENCFKTLDKNGIYIKIILAYFATHRTIMNLFELWLTIQDFFFLLTFYFCSLFNKTFIVYKWKFFKLGKSLLVGWYHLEHHTLILLDPLNFVLKKETLKYIFSYFLNEYIY
jgi:hypothetical protein